MITTCILFVLSGATAYSQRKTEPFWCGMGVMITAMLGMLMVGEYLAYQ